MAGHTVTPEGIGGLEALRVFSEVLAPGVHLHRPPPVPVVRALRLRPRRRRCSTSSSAPAACSAGRGWSRPGAVFAENEALRWLADLAGLPAAAGGVFVSGRLGRRTSRRSWWPAMSGVGGDPTRAAVRPLIVTSTGAHSSVRVRGAGDGCRRARGRGRRAGRASRRSVGASAALAASTTTTGPDRGGGGHRRHHQRRRGRRPGRLADVAAELGTWFHVDARLRRRRARRAERPAAASTGIERCRQLRGRSAQVAVRPVRLRRARCTGSRRWPGPTHTQHAEYLDVVTESDRTGTRATTPTTSPAGRGACRSGSRWPPTAPTAYADAVEASLRLARETAELDPDAGPRGAGASSPACRSSCSAGWAGRRDDYYAWSDRALDDGLAFVVPTSWQGETVLRFCFVNPRTTLDDVRIIIDSMA